MIQSRVVLVFTAVIFFFVGLVLVQFGNGFDAPAVSAAFIIAMALPSYAALWRWLGTTRAFATLLFFSIIPLIVEGFAVATGFPYGSFSYTVTIGNPLFGLVPWTVAFAYLPLLLGAATLSSRLAGTERRRFIPATALLVVMSDLVIDPAAVSAGFWVWESPGLYYGIPVINFLGWAVTGTLYAALFHIGLRDRFERGEPIPAGVSVSMLLILAFWSGYLFREYLLIPAIVGVLLIGGILYLFLQKS